MSKAILVVDDEPSNLNFLVAAVRKNGFEVMQAATADEALGLLESTSTQFALAVLDIRLRGESGLALAKQIAERQKEARFLFISGSPTAAWSPSEVSALRELPPHAYCFLPKPFTSQSIEECLRCLLADPERRPSDCDKHGLKQLPPR